jgi:ABC-2 type transport system ATP-binding protein
VRGIDLEIEAGEIFALLGPNRAGKTTTLEILEGFRKRSGGDAVVLGLDPEHRDRAWRDRIGIVITGVARGIASLRPYRCPQCGTMVS